MALLILSQELCAHRWQYEYIAINPYMRDEWLVVWSDGTLSWSLPPSFSSIFGAAAEWLRRTATDSNLAIGGTPTGSFQDDLPSPRSSVSSSTTLHRPSPACPPPAERSYFSYHPHSGSAPNIPQHHGLTGPPSTFSYPPTPPVSLWTGPQDSSLTQMFRLFQTFQQLQPSNSFGSSYNPFGLSGSGLGGGGFFDPSSGLNAMPVSMFSPPAFSGTMGLGGVDPTGGLLTSGFPVDSMSLAGSMGVDPISCATYAGCNIM